MRAKLLLGSALLPAVAVLSACGSQVPVAEGFAAPVTAAEASIADAAEAAAAKQAAKHAPTTAAKSTQSSKPTSKSSSKAADDLDDPILIGPRGIEPLWLGDSAQKATRSGLIGKIRVSGGPCRVANLTTDPAGEAMVSISDRGVESIDGYVGLNTPEGIGIGDKWDAALRMYPEAKERLGDDVTYPNGIATVAVPGNSAAVYRFTRADNKITEIQLWTRNNPCYV